MSTAHAHADVVATVGAVLLVTALLLVARALARVSMSRKRFVASFAGGVSLAFVSLELFVELFEGAELELHHVVRVGREPVHTIALLMLAATVATFLADAYGARRVASRRTYAVAATPQTVYAALVGAALVEELYESARAFAVFWFAMALHLGVTEHRLRESFPREHRGALRAIEATAPIVGAIVWAFAEPPVGIFHALLALVAGATILSIFREEIPSTTDVHVGAFLGGVVVFGALVQVRWWI